jgi:long-chain acyl-CoA synthetase
MVQTIIDILKDTVDKHPDNLAFQMKRGNVYEKYTYQEVAYAAAIMAKELEKMGISSGDRVAILSENRPEWGISYFAILLIKCVVVPLDSRLKADEISNLLNDSQVKALIVSKALSPLKDELKKSVPSLKESIIIEDIWLRDQKAFYWPKDIGPDDLASIVYTSGTTGNPKGVMLTHKNLASNTIASVSVIDIFTTDRFLSVLPLYHTFETTAGFLVPVISGVSITYAESLKSDKLLQNMRDTGTTVIAGVPLLYQLFYDGIVRNVEEKGTVAKIFFNFLFGLSWFFKNIFHLNIGRKLFFFIHKRFGGKIRLLASGGAYISPSLIRNFGYLGFPIIQGYGLTESSPVLTCTSLKKDYPGSAGLPLPGVTVKINEPDAHGCGEIIATGSNIMKGYYQKKDETADVLKEGWLYTGDLGYFDRNGFLFIIGRSKDVIVTGSGMNVYPDEVEEKLVKSPFIAEVCIVGKKMIQGIKAGMEEVHAVIFPDMEYFTGYATKNELDLSPAFIRNIIATDIKKYNESVTDYKRVMSFDLRDSEFPKTALKKIKRFEIRKEVNK